MGFATFGNELYSGRRSFRFIEHRRVWYSIAAVLMLVAVLALVFRGLNESIEFRGGSEFDMNKVSNTSQSIATNEVASVISLTESDARVSKLGLHGIRVQTEHLTSDQTLQVKNALAKGYGISPNAVTASFVGPSWGGDVSKRALEGLVVFLVLVTIVISAYFRTWKMAAAGVVALIHDLLLTVGVYAVTGFEVSPATVIGFLTILGYSLYDTVVVFDKVRENTERITLSNRRTYEEAANLAVNQTLVRSINTSVVALLPVASILFIGAFLLGAGTLKDISLALFVGIAAGTYSSIFIATPLLVDLRRNEPELAAHRQKLLKRRETRPAAEEPAVAGEFGPAGGDAGDEAEGVPAGVASGAGSTGATAVTAAGQRQQPRRGSRSRSSARRR
jgi:preprotein translocase subunit SecF